MTIKISEAHAGEKIKGEKNDCTVRCISHAFEVPYKEAHQFMELKGRRQKKGAHFGLIMGDKGTAFGHSYKRFPRPKMTIETFMKSHPSGVFMVRIRKHVFCIKNGILLDSFQPNLNQFVTDFWLVGKSDFRVKISQDEYGTEFENKLEAVGYFYELGYHPEEILEHLKKCGINSTVGSIKCFIRTINKSKTISKS